MMQINMSSSLQNEERNDPCLNTKFNVQKPLRMTFLQTIQLQEQILSYFLMSTSNQSNDVKTSNESWQLENNIDSFGQFTSLLNYSLTTESNVSNDYEFKIKSELRARRVRRELSKDRRRKRDGKQRQSKEDEETYERNKRRGKKQRNERKNKSQNQNKKKGGQRQRKRQWPLVVTFVGAVLQQSLEASGYIGPWVASKKHEKHTSKFQKYQLVENGMSIEVGIDGLYQISVQIYYGAIHKDKVCGRQANSYWLLLQRKSSLRKEKLIICTTNSSSEAASCFTSVIISLGKNDRLFVQQQEKNRFVDLQEGNSHIQIMLLREDNSQQSH
ncbi:PREDICTED: uncharacterized protein LOC105565989 isoform X2 [Vollenhovia emeryi]|uniref:uncharacterized protein LOC105565989 isoform X2 n=1 Tax=Vollenhovia emeryi TaxID=411798 RepID=UPI0005F57084|nr:PREDICTED: uncharacterized protein LOC105565989 isoform X2 [Vollenhovia emeryi]